MENIKKDLHIFGTSYCRGLHTISALLNRSKGLGKNLRYTQSVMKDPALNPQKSWSANVQVKSFLRPKSAALLCQQIEALRTQVASIISRQCFFK